MKTIAIFLVAIALSANALDQTCSHCRDIATATYFGPPADVDVPTFKVLRSDADGVLVAERAVESPVQYSLLRPDSTIHRLPTRRVYGLVEPEYLVTASGASQARTIYAVYAHGRELLRSNDSGKSWAPAALQIDNKTPSNIRKGGAPNNANLEIEILGIAGHGETIAAHFALAEGAEKALSGRVRPDGVYISHDYGDSWSLLTIALTARSPVGVSRVDPRRMMGVAPSGLVVSADEGHTWGSVPQQALLNQPLEITGRKEKLNALRKSGQSIPQEFFAGRPPAVYQIEFSPVRADTVFVRSSRGLLVSRDGGATWCLWTVGSDVIDQLDSLVVTADGVVFITTAETAHGPAQILRSDDQGCTFRTILRGQPKSRATRRPE